MDNTTNSRQTPIGNGTLIMIGAAILFIVISAILIFSFFNWQKGDSQPNSTSIESGSVK